MRDVAALVELQLRRLPDDRVGVGADREHHDVGLELELAAGIGTGRRRPESSGSPSSIFMQRIARTLPVAVVEDLDGLGEPVKLDAFLFRVMDLLGTRRRSRPSCGGRCS